MNVNSLINNKFQATLAVFILTSMFILWEFMNGGVISHNLLAREDLPEISNWWGLLTVPLLFWITISLIYRRQANEIKTDSKSEMFNDQVLKRFLGGLIFGFLVSLLWEFNFASYLQYFILLPVLMAFFKPVHFPECLMGFVLGMLFTFGGVLPILIGSILLVIGFLINKSIRIIASIIVK